jgi:uncharacterized protein YlxW (UPF0749 family)
MQLPVQMVKERSDTMMLLPKMIRLMIMLLLLMMETHAITYAGDTMMLLLLLMMNMLMTMILLMLMLQVVKERSETMMMETAELRGHMDTELTAMQQRMQEKEQLLESENVRVQELNAHVQTLMQCLSEVWIVS